MSIHIVSVGAVTSIGTTFPATSAAARSRLNMFRKHSQFPAARDGRPITVGRLPLDPPMNDAADRMLAFALRSAAECVAGLELGPLPVMIAVPGHRPNWGGPEIAQFSGLFADRAGFAVDPDRSGTFDTGHHGGLAVFDEAKKLIENGDAQACLVGGVNSFDVAFLDAMDRLERLKGPDTPNGIIPGEGAGFVLLASDDFVMAHGVSGRGVLRATAQAAEPSPWFEADTVNTGQGMGEVMMSLLDGEDRRADVSYCDHTGEVWRAEEWTTAYVRTGRKHGHPLDLRHPADCWGDLDAASGALLVGLAVDELERGAHSSALVTCASTFAPYRAGVLIEKHPAHEKDISS